MDYAYCVGINLKLIIIDIGSQPVWLYVQCVRLPYSKCVKVYTAQPTCIHT